MSQTEFANSTCMSQTEFACVEWRELKILKIKQCGNYLSVNHPAYAPYLKNLKKDNIWLTVKRVEKIILLFMKTISSRLRSDCNQLFC